MNNYLAYLKALRSPFQKLTKLDFLNDDNSVAFSLGNQYVQGYNTIRDTRTFIQSGSLNVALQNGMRRKATVELSNENGYYDYAVNKLWFGQRLRLSMGLILPDKTEFYLPQGVFYIKDQTSVYNPNARTVTIPLVDKWAYLDGELFGTLENSYVIPVGTNIFDASRDIIRQSKFTQTLTDNPLKMVDCTQPVFTDYYNGRSYTVPDGQGGTKTVPMTDTGYTITGSRLGGKYSNLLLELNAQISGWMGYDQTGALRIDASQDDIADEAKPILWTFDPKNVQLLGISETAKNSEVYNDIIVVGEGLDGYEVVGRAQNFDPSSETNINLIGRKTLVENKSDFWNVQQCQDWAEWLLKRKTILKKSISISSTQMFHLYENGVVAIIRDDKDGSPLEKHLIQSYTLPLGETGQMTINATSVNDYPQLQVS